MVNHAGNHVMHRHTNFQGNLRHQTHPIKSCNATMPPKFGQYTRPFMNQFSHHIFLENKNSNDGFKEVEKKIAKFQNI